MFSGASTRTTFGPERRTGAAWPILGPAGPTAVGRRGTFVGAGEFALRGTLTRAPAAGGSVGGGVLGDEVVAAGRPGGAAGAGRIAGGGVVGLGSSICVGRLRGTDCAGGIEEIDDAAMRGPAGLAGASGAGGAAGGGGVAALGAAASGSTTGATTGAATTTGVEGFSGAGVSMAGSATAGASESSPAFFFLVAGFFVFTFSRSTCAVCSTAVPPAEAALLNHSLIDISRPIETVDMCPLTIVSEMPSSRHLVMIALDSMPSSFAICEIRLPANVSS